MKKHSRFIYESYIWQVKGKDLHISFIFKIEPNIYFKPKIVIKNINHSRFRKIKKEVLDNLVFHLGLMEIPTYWKAICSPEIVITAGYLSKEQIKWWQNLIIKGMGQFFYENKLSWQKPKITCRLGVQDPSLHMCVQGTSLHKQDYLVPMGGGKDSIVTLEALKKQRKQVNCFVVNPNKHTKAVLRVAGIKNPIIAVRKIDSKLLELNKKGYLNGHTPFTALLSFLAVFCAILFGYKNVAFSNEKSADQGNLKYLGKTVNHQWAKSSEFEKKFKKYIQKYLASGVSYFSYLRKYSELEIAGMFVKYPKYFHVFSSCNAGMRISPPKAEVFRRVKWCGSCPKCLFTYLILCPYLEKKELLRIFGKDLLREPKSLPVLMDLIGKGKHKPFECVGTYQESRKAFKLCFEKSRKEAKSVLF